jgi:hypothetical protein
MLNEQVGELDNGVAAFAYTSPSYLVCSTPGSTVSSIVSPWKLLTLSLRNGKALLTIRA